MQTDDAAPMLRSAHLCVAVLVLLLSVTLAHAQTYTPTDLGANFVPWAVNQHGAVCGQLDRFPGWWFPGWASPQVLPGVTAETPGICKAITDNGDVAGDVVLGDQNLGFTCRAPCTGIQLAKMPKWAATGLSGIGAMANDRSWTGWAIGVDNACWLWASKPMGNYYLFPKCLFNTGTAGPVPVSFMVRDGSELIASYDMGSGELGFNVSFTPSTGASVELPRGNIHGVSPLHWAIGDGGDPEGISPQLWLPDHRTRLLTPPCLGTPTARQTARLAARLPEDMPLPPKLEQLLTALDRADRRAMAVAGDIPLGSSGLGINQAVSAVGFTQCTQTIYSWRWDHTNANPAGTFTDLDTISGGASIVVPVDIGFGGHIIAICNVGSEIHGCLLTPGEMARTAAVE